MVNQPLCNIHFEDRDNYLYVFVTGPTDSVAVSKYFYRQTNDKARELGHRRIMIEEDFPNLLSPAEMFQVASFVAELFRNQIRFAHVDYHLSDRDLNIFGETVAGNRGLLVKTFNQTDLAEAWLLS